MNTRELDLLDAMDDWDEPTLTELVARFVRDFHRLPRHDELLRFRRARGRLELRMPRQARRRVASVIAAH